MHWIAWSVCAESTLLLMGRPLSTLARTALPESFQLDRAMMRSQTANFARQASTSRMLANAQIYVWNAVPASTRARSELAPRAPAKLVGLASTRLRSELSRRVPAGTVLQANTQVTLVLHQVPRVRIAGRASTHQRCSQVRAPHAPGHARAMALRDCRGAQYRMVVGTTATMCFALG